MAKKGFLSGYGKIGAISLGLAYILFNLWAVFNVKTIFPGADQAFWFRVFISYAVLAVFVIAIPTTRKRLFSIKFVDFLPRFALWFGIGFILFSIFIAKIYPFNENLIHLLASVPISLALVHAFTIAMTESILFQGYLDHKVGIPWSPLIAGLFHLGVWSGGTWWIILTSGGLFLFFSFVNYTFRKNENDISPAVGTHFAFNMVKLGLVAIAGGMLI